MLTNYRKLTAMLVISAFVPACQRGSDGTASLCSEGRGFADAGNYARAFNVWGESSIDASAKMKLRAALDCLESTGISNDAESASRWIIDRAQEGIVEGQLFAGMLYIAGTGVDIDYDEGLAWLEKAEAGGSETAAFIRRELMSEIQVTTGNESDR